MKRLSKQELMKLQHFHIKAQVKAIRLLRQEHINLKYGELMEDIVNQQKLQEAVDTQLVQ